MTDAVTRTTEGGRSWLRYDPAGTPPLGAYAAKQCPVRTQLDVLRPVEPADVPEFTASLGQQGREHEQAVLAELAAGRGERIPRGGRRDREAWTLAAMDRGVPLILDGRLPIDEAGRRAGEPDVLVRHGDEPVDGRWRYAPADAKGHGSTKDRGLDVVVQALDTLAVPGADDEVAGVGRKDGIARGDVLQLAHYHRMLEVAGRAADGRAWGAIIDRDTQVVWYPLDAETWRTATADEDRATKLRTALEVYDFEFAFRLDIATVATRRLDDPDVDLLVEPVNCSECGTCPWRLQCWPQLEAVDHVSLLPKVGYDEWRALEAVGLDAMPALAAAAPTSVEGMSDSKLAEAVAQAQARIADAPATPVGPGAPTVPSADVEVDIDMENVTAGAYLWGALVTVRAPEAADLPTGYAPFASWRSPLDDAALAELFATFWAWLTDLRRTCAERGLTFNAYCWSASAENQHLRAGARAAGVVDEVEAFIDSDDWVDLCAWFRRSYRTGFGNGLKVVAPLFGFAWRDEDAGGGMSTLWYEAAVDPARSESDRQAERDRLLAYNEDDVQATRFIRDELRV